MPYRRPYRRQPYRRTNRRLNNRRRRGRFSKKRFSKGHYGSLIAARRSSGIPDSLYMKMRYTTSIPIGGQTQQTWLMCGNSVYDPDNTGTGGQPQYYDQISTLYGKYTVFGSAISILPYAGSATASTGQYFVSCQAVSDRGDVSPSGIHDAIDNPNSKWRMVNTIYNQAKMIKMFKKTKHVFGLKDAQDSPGYSGFGANPANLWFWQIYAQAADELTNFSGKLLVTIDYYVKWSDRIDVHDV